MLDASGKMKSGFVAGEYGDFGNYDQCLDISYSDSDIHFVGQHCMYKMHLPLPLRHHNPKRVELGGTEMNGTWLEKLAKVYKFLYATSPVNGLCMPSTCSKHEIEPFIRACRF